jgi:hypothetical protein
MVVEVPRSAQGPSLMYRATSRDGRSFQRGILYACQSLVSVLGQTCQRCSCRKCEQPCRQILYRERRTISWNASETNIRAPWQAVLHRRDMCYLQVKFFGAERGSVPASHQPVISWYARFSPSTELHAILRLRLYEGRENRMGSCSRTPLAIPNAGSATRFGRSTCSVALPLATLRTSSIALSSHLLA